MMCKSLSILLRCALGLAWASGWMGVQAAQAAASAPGAGASGWRTECLGYYSISLPGDFEYSLNKFGGFYDYAFAELPAWGTHISVEGETLFISPPATAADLKDQMDVLNKGQQKKKSEFLEMADFIDKNPDFAKDSDPDGRERINQRAMAASVPFYASIPDRAAFFFPPKDGVIAIRALVNERIIATRLKNLGTPQETLDAFLRNYHPRARFEMPTGPGVCVPYGYVTGATQLAHVAMAMQLKDQPDIVIYLDAVDNTVPTEDPQKFLRDGVDPGVSFVAITDASPMDKGKSPFRSVEIDGRKGLSVFALLDRDPEQHLNNPANGNKDWGYLAYVPAGLKDAPAGTAFTLTVRIERFSRFARKPMTEQEFRDLVHNIVAGIKRRPGAWVGH